MSKPNLIISNRKEKMAEDIKTLTSSTSSTGKRNALGDKVELSEAELKPTKSIFGAGYECLNEKITLIMKEKNFTQGNDNYLIIDTEGRPWFHVVRHKAFRDRIVIRAGSMDGAELCSMYSKKLASKKTFRIEFPQKDGKSGGLIATVSKDSMIQFDADCNVFYGEAVGDGNDKGDLFCEGGVWKHKFEIVNKVNKRLVASMTQDQRRYKDELEKLNLVSKSIIEEKKIRYCFIEIKQGADIAFVTSILVALNTMYYDKTLKRKNSNAHEATNIEGLRKTSADTDTDPAHQTPIDHSAVVIPEQNPLPEVPSQANPAPVQGESEHVID